MDQALTSDRAETLDPNKRPLTPERRQHLDELARRARLASAAFYQLTQEQVDRIVRAMVIRGLEKAQELAFAAVAETSLGVVEDKAIKNMVAVEFVYDSIKDKKTVGVIRKDPDKNLKEVAEPVGVVLGLTPITNPTSTVLFKALMVAKTRNALIVCAHPKAERCSNEAARIMAEAGVAAGAPEGFIQWVDEFAISDSKYLMGHPDVSLIDATGGPGAVKAAYGSGKPALGVGAGNVPCYIHQSADLRMAVVGILTSKTFDNGTICASEQTVLVDRPVYDEVVRLFGELGAHVCSAAEVALLERTVVDPVTCRMQPMAVGQAATKIAAYIGLEVAPHTKILLAPLAGVGPKHPLSCEKLFPVLGILPVDGEDEGIRAALDVLYFGGVGHTASIFAEDEGVVDRYAAAMNAGRVVVNSPSSIGALGGVYNDLTPTFSFGCGTGGGNITMANVSVEQYLNIKQVATRTPAHQWFRAPSSILFNAHALENLGDLEGKRTLIVTSQDLDELGFVERIRHHLPAGTACHVFNEVEIEPTYEVVMRGVQAMKHERPDQIIAVGGGSVLDAAKAMRLFYTNPDLDFHSLETTFLDLRKRVIRYPRPTSTKVTLVAVPTTSGTGSEVTAVAVITNQQNGRKVPLYDVSLLPDMAIVDPQLLLGLPPAITADTGLDALTHALEALVSVFASDYTDGLAMQAARLVFEHLPRAVHHGKDLEARQRMHNAATIAGLAFANAFVGVNHALAHAVGAILHLSHGRANAILLPHVIRYNGSLPSKFMPFPNVKAYVAPEKYARFAASMGLSGETESAQVEALAQRVEALLREVGIPTSLREATKLGRAEFESRVPDLVQTALDDISTRSNPRMPMIMELSELLLTAYEGHGQGGAPTNGASHR